jgi:transcriptional regulator with XRE-family HTH domain
MSPLLGATVARKERPLDTSTGPVPAFAADLRRLRAAAGCPTYREMATKVHCSQSLLSEAAGGVNAPTWEAARLYLKALDVPESEFGEWRGRWARTRSTEFAGPRQSPAPSGAAGPAEPEQRRSGSRKRRRSLLLAAGSIVCAGIVIAATMYATAGDGRSSSAFNAAGTPVTVVVQNMIAVGSTSLIEDRSPAYLSSRTQPFCADRSCKISGTDMWTGATLKALCHEHGTRLTNYNVDAPESRKNPNRSESNLWYYAETATGERGYISEVYLAPQFRGGSGLSACTRSAAPRG